jgi:hypothetical protein
LLVVRRALLLLIDSASSLVENYKAIYCESHVVDPGRAPTRATGLPIQADANLSPDPESSREHLPLVANRAEIEKVRPLIL